MHATRENVSDPRQENSLRCKHITCHLRVDINLVSTQGRAAEGRMGDRRKGACTHTYSGGKCKFRLVTCACLECATLSAEIKNEEAPFNLVVRYGAANASAKAHLDECMDRFTGRRGGLGAASLFLSRCQLYLLTFIASRWA
jgi:hypothetical protein